MTTLDYKSAGVDIAAGNEAVQRIKDAVESTFSPNVLTSLGSFGAMYDLQTIMRNYKHPVLVQSIDGVGTKMMVAKLLQKFDTIGIDLVSATTNDIIVLGATPLTLLDYIANDKLQPDIIEQIITGMVLACKENNIALIGGETAEMPGTYLAGEHDLVGVITGVVEKEKSIIGKDIKVGDSIVGFASSGLHTNGYSLARKLLFEVGKYNVLSQLSELKLSLGEELLIPHINYTRPILHMLNKNIAIKGMAHITGGGILENLPRILPRECAAEINKHAWPTLPLFDILTTLGKLNDSEAYRTFNMGLGLCMIIDPQELAPMQKTLQEFPDFPLYEIGKIVSTDTVDKRVRLL